MNTKLGLLLSCFLFAHSAQAMLSSPLSTRGMSAERYQQVKSFVQTQVRADIENNFNVRVAEVAKKSNASVEPPMSRETQAVLMKGAFYMLKSKSHLPLDEAVFDKGMSKVLNFLAANHVFPQAITVGMIMRRTVGAGIVNVGGNVAVEANFYLQKGKLMMTNYGMVGAQVGVGTPSAITEFYAALCFGSCYGGAPNGWYVGFDGNIAGGLGVGLFLEVGIDVSDLFDEWFGGPKYTMQDMYDAATVYVGFGIDEGVGTGVAGNLYDYFQIGQDTVLANPGAALRPELISSQAPKLKFH